LSDQVEKSSSKGRSSKRIDEAREILRMMRQCRSRLNNLRLDHAAAYADIAVQLLKQSIADEERGEKDS
jgi:hypothetical protein